MSENNITIQKEKFSIVNTTKSQREDIINKSIGLTYGDIQIPEEHRLLLNLYIDGFIELSDTRSLMLKKITGGGGRH